VVYYSGGILSGIRQAGVRVVRSHASVLPMTYMSCMKHRIKDHEETNRS